MSLLAKVEQLTDSESHSPAGQSQRKAKAKATTKKGKAKAKAKAMAKDSDESSDNDPIGDMMKKPAAGSKHDNDDDDTFEPQQDDAELQQDVEPQQDDAELQQDDAMKKPAASNTYEIDIQNDTGTCSIKKGGKRQILASSLAAYTHRDRLAGKQNGGHCEKYFMATF